jgi:MoxR-like ATPase
MATTTPHGATTTVSKLRQIAHELSSQFLEREDVIKGMLLGLIAQQHVLLVGAPGTAKSALARAMAERVQGGSHFEILLTKFTTPEEVFGPISLSALQQDRYTRLLDGRMAKATTAMVDEVGKASSAILNALLALMADKVYHNDGQVLPCPLISLVGASNELPDGYELAALYDRFLLRYEVKPVSEAAFAKLIEPAQPPQPAETIGVDELKSLHTALPAVSIPTGILHNMVKLRCELRQKGFVVSDRRWRASLAILRASALLEGRAKVNEDDMEVLPHLLWARPSDHPVIAQAVGLLANPLRAKATELLDRASAVYEEATKLFSGSDADALQKAAMHANTKLKGIITEVQRLIDTHPDQDVSRAEEVLSQVKGMNTDIVRRGFGL